MPAGYRTPDRKTTTAAGTKFGNRERRPEQHPQPETPSQTGRLSQTSLPRVMRQRGAGECLRRG